MGNQVVYREIVLCPVCHSDSYRLHDPGEILAGFVITIGSAILTLVAGLLGQLVGLHLWHWMTGSWPSVTSIARCGLVWGAACVPMILLFRRPIKRLAGRRRWACGNCGYVDMQVRQDPRRSTKVLLGLFLLVYVGFVAVCAAGGDLGLHEMLGLPTPSHAAARPAPTSLAGDWVAGDGTTYRFTASNGSAFTGTIVIPSICHPARIHVTAKGDRTYAGTVAAYDDACKKVVRTSQITIRISADWKTADVVAKGCDQCGEQSWTRR